MDYGNPFEEHLNTRTNVSIFDVSHMGRLILRGKKVYEFLQRAVTKDLSKVKENNMSGPVLLLNDEGGIIDDIMLYNFSEDTWLAVVNASNIEKDISWLTKLRERFGYASTDVEISNVTEQTALLAIQGPKSPDVLEGLGIGHLTSLKILEFVKDVELLGGKALLVSRSGWTGEEVRSFGFEILGDVELCRRVFRKVVELGAKPAGLIARDTLRLEMGYLLVGSDIGEDINPIEARYWLALSFGKKGFVGCEALERIYENGISRVRIGLKLKKGARTVPRHGNEIIVSDKVVGHITSGAYSPFIKRGIALGYIDVHYAYLGYKVHVRIRNKLVEAKIVDPPFI